MDNDFKENGAILYCQSILMGNWLCYLEGFAQPIRVMLNLQCRACLSISFSIYCFIPFKASNGLLAKDPELNSG